MVLSLAFAIVLGEHDSSRVEGGLLYDEDVGYLERRTMIWANLRLLVLLVRGHDEPYVVDSQHKLVRRRHIYCIQACSRRI